MREFWGLLTSVGLVVGGCSANTKIITLKQTNLDGNSEYFVCEGGEGKTCHGERAGEMDPSGYQARVEVHSPPTGCANGASDIEIVLEGSDVKRVRYQCSQKLLTPPCPSGSAGGPGTAPSGLPPAAPEPGPGTGLPGGAP